MKDVTVILNGEVCEIQNLGEQQLSSSHLRSDICYHFCDLFKQCSKFLYNAATPCLLAMDHPEEGTGFYFKKKRVMKTKDFEQAIEALGAQGLEILKFSYQLNGGVAAVFARIGEYTFLKWDAYGRGFCFDVEQEPGSEGKPALAGVEHPEYLDYRRDPDFDLKFD